MNVQNYYLTGPRRKEFHAIIVSCSLFFSQYFKLHSTRQCLESFYALFPLKKDSLWIPPSCEEALVFSLRKWEDVWFYWHAY